MIQTEIAVLRFGLGARTGDLAAAGGDPRAWLMAQIEGAVPLAGNTPLAPSDRIFAELLAARDALEELKRESAAQRAPTDATAAAAFNPVRDAYLPHYRAQVLARAQSAALTTRPFAERLVHFWTNHFAVSADKGAIFGIAGTLENEAIRPHVGGRFVDLLTAVEQHPAMIAFLDNQYSVGKDSVLALVAARRGAARARARASPRRDDVRVDVMAALVEQGMLLQSARGPLPNVAELVAGEAIKGSWWGHPQGHAIFAELQSLDDSLDVVRMRLVNGKVTFVHRRLWPALVRVADRFTPRQLAALHEEHTASGAHRVHEQPFPDWVPADVIAVADGLSVDEAEAQLPAFLLPSTRP